VSPGGAAPNTAVALARLGQRVTVAGIVADDHEGTVIRESLLEEGVDLSPLVTVRAGSDARTGRTLIVVDQGGVRLTGLDAGVNELLADVLRRDPDARGRLVEAARRSRIVNLTSFSGGKERELQRDLLDELREDVLVGFDPGGLYAPLGLDGLAPFTLRCDVLYAYETRLRLMIKSSSAGVSIGDHPSFQTVLEALFRWRAARVDRPLVVVVKRPRHAEGQLEPSTEGYEMITIAVGRRSVEELVSARVPASSGVGIIDNIGQGDAIAAAVHLGLLRGGPLDECANLASVLANEVAAEIGTRAGLPYRSTIRPAWAKYFPLVDLPPWVPTG
jgi:sugar/nucleoside kinase (ribokinase family)